MDFTDTNQAYTFSGITLLQLTYAPIGGERTRNTSLAVCYGGLQYQPGSLGKVVQTCALASAYSLTRHQKQPTRTPCLRRRQLLLHQLMLLDTKLPISYISKRIWPDIIRVLLISIIFQGLKMTFSDYLPAIPLQLPAILGSSISLLLAFNISQSYDRWWEARKIWGAIVNDSRSLTMQFSGFVEESFLRRGEADSPLRVFVYRQIAWSYGLGQALRSHDPLPIMEPYLSKREAAVLQNHTNKPLALLALHTEQLKDLYQQQAINSFQEVQLNSTLVRLCDSMGAAERIKNTVFPSSYRLLIHLFIYLFLGSLSLGLVETIGLWEIPVLLIIASTYFLLERTARYLQDPFTNKPTDTPVTSIGRTIEINLMQLLQESDIPEPIKSDTYYMM